MHLYFLIGGFVIILFGVVTIFEGGFLRYGIFVAGKITGIVAIVCGIISIGIGYKGITSESKHGRQYDDYLKCTKCGKIYNNYEISNQKCPACSGLVENITGFFERHPEFMNEKHNHRTFD